MAESDNEVESRPEKKHRKKKSLTVKMTSVADRPDRMAAVVGYFPSGYDPQNAPETPEVNLYRHKNHPYSRLELVVRPQNSNVEFIGKSYEGEAAVHQPCHYALGILDKETKTLKVVPIAGDKIFRLEPRMKVSPSAEQPSKEQEEGATEQASRRISDLTSRYGTKKQRMMDSKLKLINEQTKDPSARTDLPSELFDSDTKDNEALKNPESTAVPNIPPHDLSATTPEKAYLLDEIILRGEWDYLSDILELLHSGVAERSAFWAENYYPSFVANRIPFLKEIKGEEEKKKQASIYSYITHLVNFWKLAVSSRRAKSTSTIYHDAITKYKIPRVIYQRFATLFLDPASNVASTDKKELLVGYILVLTLFADKFATSPVDISKDLGLTQSELRLYFLQLGCKSSSQGIGQPPLWRLSVPLKTTEAKKRRRARK